MQVLPCWLFVLVTTMYVPNVLVSLTFFYLFVANFLYLFIVPFLWQRQIGAISDRHRWEQHSHQQPGLWVETRVSSPGTSLFPFYFTNVYYLQTMRYHCPPQHHHHSEVQNAGQCNPKTVNEGQRRPTQVNDSQWQPTQAHNRLVVGLQTQKANESQHQENKFSP